MSVESCVIHEIIHVSIKSHLLDFSVIRATINNMLLCYSKLMIWPIKVELVSNNKVITYVQQGTCSI